MENCTSYVVERKQCKSCCYRAAQEEYWNDPIFKHLAELERLKGARVVV